MKLLLTNNETSYYFTKFQIVTIKQYIEIANNDQLLELACNYRNNISILPVYLLRKIKNSFQIHSEICILFTKLVNDHIIVFVYLRVLS